MLDQGIGVGHYFYMLIIFQVSLTKLAVAVCQFVNLNYFLSNEGTKFENSIGSL